MWPHAAPAPGLRFPKALDPKDRLWAQPRGWRHTHVHDEEVEPAPGVGEVHLEAIGHPLEQHLQHEDVGEHLVGVLEQNLDGLPLLQVDVLEGLQTRPNKVDMMPEPGQFHPARGFISNSNRCPGGQGAEETLVDAVSAGRDQQALQGARGP